MIFLHPHIPKRSDCNSALRLFCGHPNAEFPQLHDSGNSKLIHNFHQWHKPFNPKMFTLHSSQYFKVNDQTDQIFETAEKVSILDLCDSDTFPVFVLYQRTVDQQNCSACSAVVVLYRKDGQTRRSMQNLWNSSTKPS
jgi:hypothetical protein